MATLLNVYDRATRKKTAVLQNAYNITETQEINQIYSLRFTLPQTDEKNQYCLPRHYIRYGDTGELYRIKSPTVNDSDVGTITYECEHVITTLCDDVMFGSFTYGGKGVYTKDVITWILSKQKTKNWVLGSCAFSYQYEYLWEQENLLNALYSVPHEFTSSYMWVFNTQSYPWTISIKTIDPTATPEYYLRARSNILTSGTSADYSNICTRIYPLGYGEGVNQLTIKEATVDASGNAVATGGSKYGKTYIQSPTAYTNKYGIVEKVLIDRRFEQPNALYGYAKTMLGIYQEPTMSRSFNVTDLYPITNKPLDDAEVGKICKLTQDNTKAYITRTERVWDVPGDLKIDLSTKTSDIASNVADLADRVRIESVYAQGATQIYQHAKDANATPDKGMIISLYFPQEMRQINKVLLHLKLAKFRAYSSTTSTNEQVEKSTVAAEINVKTTEATTIRLTTTEASTELTQVSDSGAIQGKTSPSTQTSSIVGSTTTGTTWAADRTTVFTGGTLDPITAGVGDVENATITGGNTGFQIYEGDKGHYHNFSSYFSHNHSISVTGKIHDHTISLSKFAHSHSINLPEGFGSHSHNFSLPNHTHNVPLKKHKHTIDMPSHKHAITIPAHLHKFTIPAHSHKIAPGIFESGKPTAFDIFVDNTKKATVTAKKYDGDIVSWLLNDKNLVPRDKWIELKIVPNDLAYVISSVFVQGFVQSRGGGNY